MSMSSSLEQQSEAYQTLAAKGYGRFFAAFYRELLADCLEQLPAILSSFGALAADRFMGDGGTYRFRAYSRFRLDDQGLAMIDGNSIFQEKEDNPLNGGVLRTYEPLAPEVAESAFLRALIAVDHGHVCHCDPDFGSSPLRVGVHQVRIVARGKTPGQPAPEGIHRDRERFTFQHFMGRHHAEGGEFRAYDQNKQLTFAWTQQDCLDTLMFEGTTWHAATPIIASTPEVEGCRDIFLIDFEPI